MVVLERLKNMSFRTKLGLAFLILSITPMALISGVFHYSFVQNNQEQVYDTLYSIALNKENTLRQHMTSLSQQALHFSNTDFVRYAMSKFYGFSFAFGFISDSPAKSAKLLKKAYEEQGHFKNLPTSFEGASGSYAGVHSRFNDGFKDYTKATDFSDVILINMKGQVVYSAEKNGYFGANLSSDDYSSSPLGLVYMRLNHQLPEPQKDSQQAEPKVDEWVQFVDFSYDKVTNDVTAYLVLPIKNHAKTTGIIALALPTDPLTAIMARRQGLGDTGETYIVDDKGLPITALLNKDDPKIALRQLHKAGRDLNLAAVNLALKGENGVNRGKNYLGITSLSAYSYLDFFDSRWAVIAEISERETQASSVLFRNLILFIGFLSTLIILAIVYLLSRSLTRPLHSLMQATEAVAEGELDREIAGSSRGDEMGRLATSFTYMQRSIQQQIGVIREKNSELEEKVAVINEQNDALKMADRVKDEFLTNTSHELRTPLSGVIGITQSVLHGVAGELNPSQTEQLNMALTGATRLAHLVDDLQDFHKVRHNRLRISTAPVNATMVINHVLELSKHLLADKPIQMYSELPEEVGYVLADATRLEQVLYNLIGNSIKYTEAGKIRVSVREAQGQVIFSVTDTGIGIAAENIAQIFDPFKQVDGSTTRRQGGSGLGLAISQQLIQLMEGEIWVESNLGLGSTFSFALPMCEMVEQDIGVKRQSLTRLGERNQVALPGSIVPALDMPPIGSGLRVLVVDDEQLNLQVLNNHLSMAGYVLELMNDGQKALEFLQTNKVDLVILDVMLPNMSGFAVAKAIRETQDLASLPILMLTARTQTRDLMEGFHSGANDYLMKPFLQDELLSRVHNLLAANQVSERNEENRLLKEEVARRIEAEQALKSSQARMTSMLESVEDAIITMNPFDQIVFFNQAAQRKLGYNASQVIGSDIARIIDKDGLRKALQEGANVRVETSLNIIRHDGVQLKAQAFITQVNGSQADDVTIVLHDIGDISSESIIVTAEVEKNTVVKQTPELVYRQTIVNIMNDSLALWEGSTKKSKIALADQSRIWSVYLDRSSAQTRTMDKYFLEQTLPKKPRWRDVLRTGSYVLQETKSDGELALRIQSNITNVKDYLGLE